MSYFKQLTNSVALVQNSEFIIVFN